MQQRDYILDIIRQMSHFVAQAIGFRGKKQQAEQQLQRASVQLVGIDLDAAEELSIRSLRMLFLSREGLDVARCMVLGVLLKERAESCEEGNRKQELLTRAKILLLDAANHSDNPLPVEVMLELQQLTKPEERPEHVQEWLDTIDMSEIS